MAKTAPPKDELLKGVDDAFDRALRAGPAPHELDTAELDTDAHLAPPATKKRSPLKAWADIRAGKKKH